MMPSDCHMGWTQPDTVSDCDPVSCMAVAEPSAADHAHVTAQRPGSSVKCCSEGGEKSQISDSLCVCEIAEPPSECGQCDGGSVCVCPRCHKPNAVSTDDMEVCVSDFLGSCRITEPDLFEGAAESDVSCTCSSGGKCGRPRHVASATVADLHREQPLDTAALLNGTDTDTVLSETFFSDRVLNIEHQIHRCLSSVCGSASLRTDEYKNIAPGNVGKMHLPDSTTAVMWDTASSLLEQTRQMCLSRKTNSNSNADTETVSSDRENNRWSTSGTAANDQENMSLSAGESLVPDEHVNFGHGEDPASEASSSDQHAQVWNLPASSEDRSSGGVDSLPVSELASLHSGLSLEVASSIECIGSAPLISALNIDQNQPDLSDSSCLDRDIESLPLVNAMQLDLEDEEEKSACAVDPSSFHPLSPVMSLDISEIPDEVLLRVFSFLTPAALCQHVTGVCKRWHRLAYDHSLWKKLDVSSIRLTGFQLCQLVLRTSGAIRHLDMSGMDHLTLGEMGVVAENCPHLTHLDVGFVDNLTCPMMHAILTSCPLLEFLNVEGCRHANNELMRVLAATAGPHLKRLNFSHCSLVDESLWLMMRHLHGLTHLNIDGISWISELVVRHLSSSYSSTLESWELDGNELTDSTIESLSVCQRLRVLSISFCEQLTNLSIKYLKCLENLEKLSLRKGPGFTCGALTELLSSPTLTRLTFLDLTECQQMNDDCVKAIAQTCGQKLRKLNLSWCWDITDSGMEQVAVKCRQMKVLQLVGLHRLEGMWLPIAIETMPDLTYISFEQCNEVVDMVIEEAVRDKPDLVIYNYYGELFRHKDHTD